MIVRAPLIETRRSVVPAVAIVIGVTFTWMAFQGRTPGLNLWSDVVTGLSTASVYTGSLAAGVAAYASGQWTAAHRLNLAVSVRNTGTIRLLHFACVAATLGLGYLASIVIVGLFAAVTRTYGDPNILWLAAIGCAVVLCTAFGYAVGAIAPRRWFVAPLVAIAVYAGFVLLRVLHVPQTVLALFPAITDRDSEFTQTVLTTRIGQALFWLGLAVTLVALCCLVLRDRPTRWAARVIGLSLVLVAGGAAAVASTAGIYVTGHNSRDFVCRSDSFTICVNRGYAATLTDLTAAFERLNSIVSGTPLQVTRLEQSLRGAEGEGTVRRYGPRSHASGDVRECVALRV